MAHVAAGRGSHFGLRSRPPDASPRLRSPRNTRRAYSGALRRLDAWLADCGLDDQALATYRAELHDQGRERQRAPRRRWPRRASGPALPVSRTRAGGGKTGRQCRGGRARRCAGCRRRVVLATPPRAWKASTCPRRKLSSGSSRKSASRTAGLPPAGCREPHSRRAPPGNAASRHHCAGATASGGRRRRTPSCSSSSNDDGGATGTACCGAHGALRLGGGRRVPPPGASHEAARDRSTLGSTRRVAGTTSEDLRSEGYTDRGRGTYSSRPRRATSRLSFCARPKRLSSARKPPSSLRPSSVGASSSAWRRTRSPRPGWPQPPAAARRSAEPRASPERRSRASCRRRSTP